jgi:hypothetical protein
MKYEPPIWAEAKANRNIYVTEDVARAAEMEALGPAYEQARREKMNEFQQMDQLVSNFFEAKPFKPTTPALCDYIATLCRESLNRDPEWLLGKVGKVEWDLDDNGALQSTTKVILLEDNNGKKYKVTVEEA